jgi:hypothetical protein
MTHPNISDTLNELIQSANTSFEQGKHYVVLTYEQALREGFTPKEAKHLLFETITVFSERTIYRYLPDESKDQYFQQLGSNRTSKSLPRCQVVSDSKLNPWADIGIRQQLVDIMQADIKREEVLGVLAAAMERLYNLRGIPINNICQDIMRRLKEAGIDTAHHVPNYLDDKYKRWS